MKHFTSNYLLVQIKNWNLVVDDIHVIRGNGPTAIKSKLEYILSGPVYGTKPDSVDSSMMNVKVSHKLEEQNLENFWQIEAIGTKKMHEESAIQDFFTFIRESSVQFHDNRYHVILPWKDDHPIMPLKNKTSKNNQCYRSL